MNIQLRKIGNSEGFIVPKEVLDRNGFKSGDTLELVEDNGALTLRRHASDEEFARRMKIAKERMKKYEVALRELAK